MTDAEPKAGGFGRGDLGLVLGLAGFLLGGCAFYFQFRLTSRMDDVQAGRQADGEDFEQLVERVATLETNLGEANKRISALRKEHTDGMNEVAGVRRRVDQIEIERTHEKQNPK